MSYLGYWLLLMQNQSYPLTPPVEAEASILADSNFIAMSPEVVRVIPVVIPHQFIATGGPPLREVQNPNLQKSLNQPKQRGIVLDKKPT